jgi:hypothetical protein
MYNKINPRGVLASHCKEFYSAEYRIGLYISKCPTIKEKGKKEVEIQKE